MSGFELNMKAGEMAQCIIHKHEGQSFDPKPPSTMLGMGVLTCSLHTGGVMVNGDRKSLRLPSQPV